MDFLKSGNCFFFFFKKAGDATGEKLT